MVLTEESQQDIYPALTFEGTWTDTTTAVAIEKLYYNVDSSKIVNASVATGITAYQNNNGNPPFNNNPKSNTTANSTKVYQMNGSVNKTGLTIALKVMAGDTINIYGKSYYNLNGGTISGTTTAPTTLALLTSFAGTNAMSSKGVSGTTLNSITQLTSGITSLLGTQPAQTSNTPKAFINWILFDERFNYAGGGYDRVGSSGTVKNHNSSTIPSIVVPKNGYIYVYCSNESNINVFFDNLQIIHSRGPIVEENHYYPFGLEMKGICSRAASNVPRNKKLFNKGSELQNEEFSDGSGLEWYDVMARTYDAQLGRFMQVDPIADEENQESWSVYHYSYNNPILFNDPDGKNPILGAIIGAFTEYAGIVGNKMLFENMTFSQANSDLGWGDALDITIAAGFGAASGALDGGITKFASWAKSPTNQKILVKLLEVGVSALESSLKAMFKDEEFDLMSILSGALTEVGLGSLMKTNIHKNAADKSTDAANAATKKAEDLAKRKKPNERLVNNKKNEAAQQKKNAKLNTNLDNTGKVIKGSTAKTGSNAAQNATKKKKEKKKTES